MSEHLCHAIGCHKAVPPRVLMCGKHWELVPYLAKRNVWRTYQPGQEVTKDPSAEYLEAARAAVLAVARAEGLTVASPTDEGRDAL